MVKINGTWVVTEEEVGRAVKKTWPDHHWVLYRVQLGGMTLDDYYVRFEKAPSMVAKQLSFEGTEARGDDKWAAWVTPEEEATTCSACGGRSYGAMMCPLKVEVIKSSGVKLGPNKLTSQ